MAIEKLISLYGRQNIGKSTTLNVLIKLLTLVSDSYEIEKEYDGNATFIFNENIICVCTAGDNEEFFRQQN